jgi:hypothetical protein
MNYPPHYLNLTEENCAKLRNGEEKRLRCTVGRAPTSSSKELNLVSQDNVIKMARLVTVWKPARGLRRGCFNVGFVCRIGNEFWVMSFDTRLCRPGRRHGSGGEAPLAGTDSGHRVRR